MSIKLPLANDGSVTSYLTTEAVVTDFEAPYTLKDQLRFEKEMRDILYEEPVGYPCPSILGETAKNGGTWSFYSQNKNPYIDFSTFYFTLKRVSILARTLLVSDKKKSVRAVVWSYAAFDLYLNGKRVATERVPVYQPIRRTDVTLELSEGENDVFFAIQNFGVRDTRNMLMLQILDTDGVYSTLPIEETTLKALKNAEDWFSSLTAKNGVITSSHTPDFSVKVDASGTALLWGDAPTLDVADAKMLTVTAEVEGQSFKRILQPMEKAVLPRKKRVHESMKEIALACLEAYGYGKVSDTEVFKKVERHTICLTILAELYINGGKLTPAHLVGIDRALEIIEERCDCADFELSVLLRLMKYVELPRDYQAKIKRIALNFRYWMDENGADAMCFWSENHALTFFGCQYLAGERWQDELFVRSGRTGKEQMQTAVRRVGEWLDVVENEAFEEFCAGGYMGVTVAALLNVFDFFPKALAERAEKIIDRIFIDSATQCFDGIHMSPMGRIYRSSLFPYVSSVQAILHLLSDDNVYYNSPWLMPLAYSKYTIPDSVRELMTGSFDKVFYSGRAEINTRKTPSTFLSSVSSPRRVPFVEKCDTGTEYYRTKIMNEGFHGTSLFTPGGYGYQQHLWYAAISNRMYTFVNLPGSERDFSGMRPGYWYGNLVFPALKQEGGELYCRYIIPDNIPTKFTHAYYPAYAADELREAGGFRFARVNGGYLALWCSRPLTVHNTDAVNDFDLRAYGTDTCWYVRVGEKSEYGSFDSFVDSCLSMNISHDLVAKKLEA